MPVGKKPGLDRTGGGRRKQEQNSEDDPFHRTLRTRSRRALHSQKRAVSGLLDGLPMDLKMLMLLLGELRRVVRRL